MSEQNRVWYTGEISGDGGQRPVGLPATEAKRVLLFGGTFDPPHVGHLTMAQLALEQTGVDEVWFLPAPNPPHKQEIGDDTFGWRAAMVTALLEGRAGLRTMPIEEFLPRPSYTVDTVHACQSWYPDVEFSFLLGADSLEQLLTWHGVDELAKRVPFYVVARSGTSALTQVVNILRESLPELRATAIEMPLLDVSSTWLRERLEAGADICGLISPAVLDLWHKGPQNEV